METFLWNWSVNSFNFALLQSPMASTLPLSRSSSHSFGRESTSLRSLSHFHYRVSNSWDPSPGFWISGRSWTGSLPSICWMTCLGTGTGNSTEMRRDSPSITPPSKAYQQGTHCSWQEQCQGEVCSHSHHAQYGPGLWKTVSLPRSPVFHWPGSPPLPHTCPH